MLKTQMGLNANDNTFREAIAAIRNRILICAFKPASLAQFFAVCVLSWSEVLGADRVCA